MKELEALDTTVVSRFVEVSGKRYLAGVAHLPEIDWYEITLLDLDTLLPISSFTGILVVYGLTLLARWCFSILRSAASFWIHSPNSKPLSAGSSWESFRPSRCRPAAPTRSAA